MYSNVEHNQPSSLLVKLGESLTISCKISGYALSDSSKAPSWIRHTRGKILEFIGMIHAGGGIDYKDSLKNKFTTPETHLQAQYILKDKICKLRTRLCIIVFGIQAL